MRKNNKYTQDLVDAIYEEVRGERADSDKAAKELLMKVVNACRRLDTHYVSYRMAGKIQAYGEFIDHFRYYVNELTTGDRRCDVSGLDAVRALLYWALAAREEMRSKAEIEADNLRK